MLCLFVVLVGLVAVAQSETYSVRGSFFCGAAPVAGAQVILYDKDTFTLNDKLAAGVTGADGNFTLTGDVWGDLLSQMDPYLKVYHSCNKGKLQICDNSFKFKLPRDDRYFVKGTYLEFGTFNLEVKPKDADTSCIGSTAAKVLGLGTGR